MTDTKAIQTIKKAVGRPMLEWVGKKPLEKIEFFPAQEKEVYGIKDSKEFNKLFWGDNLQVLSHLLKDYRGKVDLVYIDPPFDSKADYVKKIKLKGEEVEGQRGGLLEEKQYTDIWENDEYLQFIYERLMVIKELMSDTASIFLHCDWHKEAYLKIIMDEIFSDDCLVNEIIREKSNPKNYTKNSFGNIHDTILYYSKTKSSQKWRKPFLLRDEQKIIVDFPFIEKGTDRRYKTRPLHAPGKRNGSTGGVWREMLPPAGKHWQYRPTDLDKFDLQGRIEWSSNGNPRLKVYADESQGVFVQDVWFGYKDAPITGYPTEKNNNVLELIINSTTDKGDLVLDCFCGSGTSLALAQKMGRKWIGCDINVGAIQTTIKSLNQIIGVQIKEQQKLVGNKFDGLLAFKVLNVNDYDIFKNEIEAKETVMEIYGVEPVKRSYFDGMLDNNFVKVMPMNRVLNKLDIKNVIKSIGDEIDSFTVKPTSKSGEDTFEQGVIIVCSGAEIDSNDFIKKENKTGVRIEVRNILNDKKNLIFKQKPEARVEVSVEGKQLSVKLLEFYSPILMRKLELENQKLIDQKAKVVIDDFRQIIDSVAIDVDYNGDLFNAEIMDVPSKKEMTKAEYKYEYSKGGNYVMAAKVVDVLGEEYFETFKVTVK